MQPTPWQQLIRQEITLDEALLYLVNGQGTVNLNSLDGEVHTRFLRQVRDRSTLPPVIPLLVWRGCFYLGCPLTLSEREIYEFRQRLGMQVQLVPISEKSYRQWFLLQHADQQRIQGQSMANPLTGEMEPEDISETAELYLSQAESQVERIKTLISSALRNRASDIHLEPTAAGLRVRYRIDGILRHVTTLTPEIGRRVVVSLKVMCNMDIAESRRPQDGRIGEKYTDSQQAMQGLDLRVSTLPCVSNQKGEASEKVVLRLLRQQNSYCRIQDLGFSQRTCGIYENWLKQPQGLIILTGPTGSGKTSTLYTSLLAIANESINIVTVEDPVEYLLPGITQTQVHEAAGMTFAAGLRAILRQDPDVVMLGEIRDEETAETAVRAALTGHLVFTTLHTNDAIGAIPRLKDIGPDPGLISDALLGVVAQRLVRRVCPHCAESHTPTEAELKVLGLTITEAHPHQWQIGKGCSQCFNTGYLGREALIELLNIDDNIRQIIYEGSITQLNAYLQEIQYDSFRVAAIDKVTQGLTTVPEILRVLPQQVLVPRSVIPLRQASSPRYQAS